jgi:aminoglycoside phosphotransferase family enzyme/predicted kinase
MSPALLQRLHEPDCFPGRPGSVEVRQTHLSVVCLAGDDVYKLKKPVRFSFVDFSTVELRRQFCEDEVRLNRRLCPEVYLGVVPLYQDPQGVWSFEASPGAVIVDHAVHMRRLPEDKLLSVLLEHGEVTKADVEHLAEIVETFHRRSPRDEATLAAGGPQAKIEAILGNFDATESLASTMFPGPLYPALEKRVRRDVETLRPVLQRRMEEGRVVDGHGDLHARNIFLTDPPAIFDCIEFRPQFRCGDVAFENAFLVMDLIHRGRPDLADAYLSAYLERSGDTGQRALMPMLISYRAMVRAKVGALAAASPELPDGERAAEINEARRYLQLAAAAVVSHPPVLVVACGLPGSGKSYLLQTFAARTGWPCLATDRLRKELAGVAPEIMLGPEHYTPEANERTYSELLARAAATLAHGSCVLLDANFRTESTRAQARDLAIRHGARPVLVWVQTADTITRQRLKAREMEPVLSVSDAGLQVYEQLRGTFEEPNPGEGMTMLAIDGAAEVDANVDLMLAGMLAPAP